MGRDAGTDRTPSADHGPVRHGASAADTLPAHLFDSSLHAPAVDVEPYPDVDWVEALRTMIVIRETEDLIGRKSEQGQFKTPVHLSIGQEAVPVGTALNLRSSDYGYGNHRSHGHYLAMGGSRYALLCEILGKITGCSHGMGGSMHITAPEAGFVGSVPIVAGTIPIAVGAGLHAKRTSGDTVSIAFFGDGAVEEGVFHESLNFASTYRVPVFFLCENNIFSSHMHLSQRQSSFRIARFAEANGVESRTVDGNDVTEVYNTSRELIERSRRERVPTLLEAVTYRWRAHVGPPDDLEIGLHRREDLPNWMLRDPQKRLFDALVGREVLPTEWLEKTRATVRHEAEAEWERARSEQDPPETQLLRYLYAGTDA